MPAPKKQGRGLKSGEGKGRQKSADGSSSEDDETKRQYNRRKKAEERGQKSTPIVVENCQGRREISDHEITAKAPAKAAKAAAG